MEGLKGIMKLGAAVKFTEILLNKFVSHRVTKEGVIIRTIFSVSLYKTELELQ